MIAFTGRRDCVNFLKFAQTFIKLLLHWTIESSNIRFDAVSVVSVAERHCVFVYTGDLLL